MRSAVARLVLLLFALSALWSTPSWAQGDRPLDAYWFCYSAPDQSPIYVTPVWDARAIHDELLSEFRKVLKARYHYDGRVSCSGSTKSVQGMSLAEAEKGRAQTVAAWEKAGHKAVQVAWTGNDPPTGPPPINWSVCGATVVTKDGTPTQGPFESYLSRPFDAGEATINDQQAAFTEFLRSRYAITTTDLHPQCTAAGDEADALRIFNVLKDQAGRRGKVVETGWTLKG